MKIGLFLQPATSPKRPLYESVNWNIEVIKKADQLGYSEAWIGQHITSPWEPLPSPQQIIARSIGETSKIKLGTGVEVLYQSHPIRLAAELAQLDHLSGGRLLFGFGGGGTPTDSQLYDVDFSIGQHQEMSREALEIILSCWSPGGPDDYVGKYWTVKKPNYSENYYWHLKPFSPPEERIGFAGFMPDSSSLKLAGERGYIPLSFNVAPENISVHWDVVAASAKKTNKEPDRNKWRQIREIYVADTDIEAKNDILNGFAGEFWDTYFKPVIERIKIDHLFRRPADDPSQPVDAAYLVSSGTWFVGSPETVVDQIIEQYQLSGGFGVLLQMGFDYSDPKCRDGWMHSMELLAKEVIPRVNKVLKHND